MQFSRVLITFLIGVIVITTFVYADVADDLEKLFRQRRFDEVLAQTDQAIAKDPRYAELYYWRGRALLEKEEFEQAEQAFKLCLDRKRRHELAQAYLALVYVEQKRFDEAKKILDEGVNKSKDHRGRFLNHLGHYHMAQKEFRDADIALRRALIEEPGNLEYQRDLADLNYEDGVYAVAIQGYLEVLRQDSSDAVTYYKLSRAYFNQRQFSEALRYVTRAVDLDSHYIQAYHLAGDIFMISAQSALGGNGEENGVVTGIPQAAVDNFKNAVWAYENYLRSGGKETVDVNYRLGQAYYYLNSYEAAVRYLDRAIELGSDRSMAYDQKARALFRLQRYDEAMAAYDDFEGKISGGDPNFEWGVEHYDFFRERAVTFYQLYNETKAAGQADLTFLERAIPNYIKAIELKNDDPRLYDQLGNCFMQLKRYEEAIPWYERKIQADPNSHNAFLNLAICFINLNRTEEGMQMMIRVTELKPDYKLAYKTIANTYMHTLKNPQKGVEWYRKWLQVDPEDYEPYKWIGYYYIVQKPPVKDSAVDNLSKAMKRIEANGMDECKEIDVITWLAQAYSFYDDSKHDDMALEWAKRGLRCDPNNETLRGLKESLE